MLPGTTSPKLRYESSTPTSKGLSSPIFQRLSVSESACEASVTPDLTWVFVYFLHLCICVFLCLCIYVFAAVWWPRKDLKQRWRRVPKKLSLWVFVYFSYLCIQVFVYLCIFMFVYLRICSCVVAEEKGEAEVEESSQDLSLRCLTYDLRANTRAASLREP